MKKALALLLSFILTFSCFGLLGTGSALAEESDMSVIMQSDFNDADGTNWQAKNDLTAAYLDDDGDGVNDTVRITHPGNGQGGLSLSYVSTPFDLVAGNDYEISFYLRVPEESPSWIVSSLPFSPAVTIYETTADEDGKAATAPVKSTSATANNFYAYNDIRRTDLSTVWSVEGVEDTYTRTVYSNFTYSEHKNLVATDAKEYYSDWKKVTAKFTAVADEDGEISQTVALSFSFDPLGSSSSGGFIFDLKDVQVKEDAKVTAKVVETVIMESDFSDTTNWTSSRPASGNVTYVDEDSDGVNDYANVAGVSNSSGQGYLSAPFELVNGSEYELSFFVRIPSDSADYISGSTTFTPIYTIYETTLNVAGTKVNSVPDNSATTSNNHYSYVKDGVLSRRSGFSAVWQIGDYEAKTITNSSRFYYTQQTAVIGTTTVVKDVFADWTKITAKFTAIADEEGETSQTAAVAFTLPVGNTSYSFDLKDVQLVEKKTVVQQTVLESDLSSNTKWQTYKIIKTDLDEDGDGTADAVRLTHDGTSSGTNLQYISEPFELIPGNDYELSYYLRVPEESTSYIFSDIPCSPATTIYEVGRGTSGKANIYYKIGAEAENNNLYAYGAIRRTAFSAVWSIEGVEGTYTRNSYSNLTYSQHKDIVTTDAKEFYSDWKKVTAKFTAVADESGETSQTVALAFSFHGLTAKENLMFDIKDVKILETINNTEDTETEVAPIELTNDTERTENTIKVLALGNSFSLDSTTFIDDIAAADGTDIRVGDCYIAGCSLERHYNNISNGTFEYVMYYRTPDNGTISLSSVSLYQALTATDWDYITLQQASGNSGNIDSFEPYLGDLVAYINEICPDAEILFNATWAYPDGSSLYESSTAYDSDGDGVSDEAGFYPAIKETYLQISENYDFAPIIPVGEAIRRGRIAFDNDLSRDGHHCDDYGRLIAAFVWYETFTGISALDASVDLANVIGTTQNLNGDDIKDVAIGVTEEESLIIRTVAHEAAALYKKANEAQLAIEAIGEVTEESGEAIANAEALRAELNDDTLLPNLDALTDARTTYDYITTHPVCTVTVSTEENGYAYLVNDGTIRQDDEVTVVAAPYGGYVFDGWFENDVKVSDDQYYTFNIEADIALVAKFIPETIEYIPDIDSDGSVNLKDLVVLARHVADWDVEVNEELIDVDGSGEADLSDVVVLAQYLAGWDVTDKMVAEISAMPYEDLTDTTLKTTLLAGQSEYFNKSTLINKGNTALLARALEKAQNGEDITIVGLGGSATHGTGFTNYTQHTAQWFEDTYGINVTCVNAGIGSTGSLIGLNRLYANVLRHEPDIVFLDFSVNDAASKQSGVVHRESYEAIVRRLLKDEIAVMTFLFGPADKTDPQFVAPGAFDAHLPTMLRYDLPIIDYHHALWRYIDSGVVNWYESTVDEDGNEVATDESLTSDGLHPSQLGHSMIAAAACAYLEEISNNLENIDTTAPTLPTECIFENTSVYESSNFYSSVYEGEHVDKVNQGYESIIPTESTNFEAGSILSYGTLMGTGWICKNEDGAGGSITFELKDATSVSVFLEHRTDGGTASIKINGKTVVDNKSTYAGSQHVWNYYSEVFDEAQDVTVTITCNSGLVRVAPLGVSY